jgi:hypothetical protein
MSTILKTSEQYPGESASIGLVQDTEQHPFLIHVGGVYATKRFFSSCPFPEL